MSHFCLSNTDSIQPKRRLSQNFLTDKNVIRKILMYADLSACDNVLEVGSGLGALTVPLNAVCKKLVAIEKDLDLVKNLQQKLADTQIIHSSILDFDFDQLVDTPYHVVANLPYHITWPIVQILLRNFHKFSSMTLMVQKEFAEKLFKQGLSYSMNALWTCCFCEKMFCFDVSPNCFFPKPKVTSSVIKFVIKTNPNVALANLITCCFQQKRKLLSFSLKKFYLMDQILEAYNKLNISYNIRAENLDFPLWERLYDLLEEKAPCHMPTVSNKSNNK